MPHSPKATIVIPSLGRPESLKRCLKSLDEQTEKDFEVIILEEEGPLAAIRNQGLRRAKGEIVIFTDDDVIFTKQWLAEILKTFRNRSIVGVSGPAVIRKKYRNNRDIFRYKALYDLFLRKRRNLPGHFTKGGCWTTGACEESCSYEGPVQFLEACNMAFRREILNQFGEFDEEYKGIGDWSEPDLCFRLRDYGFKLWFNPKAKLYHEPSKSGAYFKRKKTGARYTNYLRFSEKWITPCFEHTIFKLFMRFYYFVKERGLC